MNPINETLLEHGFIQLDFPYIDELKSFLVDENFKALDQYLLNAFHSNGHFFHFFCQYFQVKSIEHIIAIRQGPDDEDGIWHDDGSRLFGFTLSLNLDPQTITGGNLLFKKKNSEHELTFPPQPFGKLIIFLTGHFDYEHKVTQVHQGKRIVIAGWGSN